MAIVSSSQCLPQPNSHLHSRLKGPLQRFFQHRHLKGLSEWGVGTSSVSRILPAVLASYLPGPCLWIHDKPQVNPRAWADLGYSLDQVLFLKEEKPLASLRTALRDQSVPTIIFDSRQFLHKSDLHALAHLSRSSDISLFLFRSFFLSNKSGNPFCAQRFNSFYRIQQQKLELSIVKGEPAPPLSLSLEELWQTLK